MPSSAAYIGLVNPKSPENVGMVLRAAGCYEATKVFYTGERYTRASKFFTDTKNAHERVPLVAVEDFLIDLPEGTTLVAIELIEGATPLMDFVHPHNAYYIFGPEDGSIKKELLQHCAHVVYIPTVGCMNLAATVNVVLYDRLSKASRDVIEQRPIAANRDTNNKIKL
jgi:tRNA(Leu) C34 or U34 (ribose-2'-O)-methylase TrmL